MLIPSDNEIVRRLAELHHKILLAEREGRVAEVDSLYKRVYELERALRVQTRMEVETKPFLVEKQQPIVEERKVPSRAKEEYHQLKGEYDFLKKEHRRLKKTYEERRLELSPRERRVMRAEIERVGVEKRAALHALPSLKSLRARYGEC